MRERLDRVPCIGMAHAEGRDAEPEDVRAPEVDDHTLGSEGLRVGIGFRMTDDPARQSRRDQEDSSIAARETDCSTVHPKVAGSMWRR